MPVNCPHCGKRIPNTRGMGGHARKCDVTPEELFWAKVDKNGPNGCWVWIWRGTAWSHIRLREGEECQI